MSNLDTVLLEVPCEKVVNMDLLNWIPEDLREIVAKNPVCSEVVIDNFNRHKEGGTRAYSRLINIVMTTIGANRPKELKKEEAPKVEEKPVEALAPEVKDDAMKALAPEVEERPIEEVNAGVEEKPVDTFTTHDVILNTIRELFAEVRDHEKLKGRHALPDDVKKPDVMWSYVDEGMREKASKVFEFMHEPRSAVELCDYLVNIGVLAREVDFLIGELRSMIYDKKGYGYILARVKRARLQILSK